LLQFRVRGKMRRQNLDGNGAVEPGVLGPIHLAQPPTPAGTGFRRDQVWC
jgi:hypothetical protein